MERNCKRILSLLLAFVMALGLMPGSVLAADGSAAPDTMEVEVYVDRQQTVSLEGTVIPEASGVAGIAAVEAETRIMGATGSTNAFDEGYVPLADNLYTFQQQSDGTWLIFAQVDGTTLYVDPHAGAGNGGQDYPSNSPSRRKFPFRRQARSLSCRPGSEARRCSGGECRHR